jgi:Mn2+/Fe2+ NRAMP family transporter
MSVPDPEQLSPHAIVAAPPRGWRHLLWLGPGFLWMVSAAGSGELLFTPRVGALYGYALLWALLAAAMLKWFINREIGRFTVCTGVTILEGYQRLPGPRNWALWLILLPQAVVAVATIAGLAASAATALILVLPGPVQLWTIAAVLSSTALVLWGRYSAVERTATVLAVALGAATLAAAASVFPGRAPIIDGLRPSLPPGLNHGEILPWLGFLLSGAAGMLWYSYWVQAKGYGAVHRVGENQQADVVPVDTPEGRQRLHGWLTQMTWDNTVAVVGTIAITLGFLILGSELLRPHGLVPEENQVAETLGHLLGGVWGQIGFWFMITAVFVGFWDTVLSGQDGFGRLLGNGTRIVLQGLGVSGRWTDEVTLQRLYIAILVTALPIMVYLAVGEPVGLLKLAGAIEAAHIPIVAGLTLYVNHRYLPSELKASGLVNAVTGLAALFFAGFAAIYGAQLMGWTE